MPSRRLAFGVLGAAAAAGMAVATRPAQAQTPISLPVPPPKQPPRTELVNVFQFQDEARTVIGAARLAPVLDNRDRAITDRITLHPRVNIPTGENMDLTTQLFGDAHFTPILVGPMADQKRFHPEGEIAVAKGASAAKAGLVISGDSSTPIAQVAAATTSPVWVQVYAGSPKVREVLAQAGAAKAKAVVVTVNAGGSVNWAAVEAVVKGTSLPVLVKGITTPQQARDAVARGAKGVIISNYRGGGAANLQSTLLLIQPVVQAVGPDVPVLADGAFRYGSDILKALAFGAKGVLIGRPVTWGLAAYGEGGVESIVEMLQTDLARFMGMSGRPTIASIDSTLVRVHAPRPARS